MKTAAFFKISRSCSSVRTFRRSSRNSWRSSLVSPSRRPPSTSACRAQIRSVSVETPRSTAISLSGRPDRLYSSTASRRNSGGYGLLKFDPLGMAEHPPCPAGQCRPSAQVSTETGALHRDRSGAGSWRGFEGFVAGEHVPGGDQDLARDRGFRGAVVARAAADVEVELVPGV